MLCPLARSHLMIPECSLNPMFAPVNTVIQLEAWPTSSWPLFGLCTHFSSLCQCSRFVWNHLFHSHPLSIGSVSSMAMYEMSSLANGTNQKSPKIIFFTTLGELDMWGTLKFAMSHHSHRAQQSHTTGLWWSWSQPALLLGELESIVLPHHQE